MRRATIAAAVALTVGIGLGTASAAGAATAPVASAGDPGACTEVFAAPAGGLARHAPLWGDQRDNGDGTFTVEAELVRRVEAQVPTGPTVVVGCAFADDNGNGNPDAGEARFGSRRAVTFEASSRTEQSAAVAVTVAAPSGTRVCDRSVTRSTDRAGATSIASSDTRCRTLGARSLPTGGMAKGVVVAAGVAGLFGWWQRRSSGVLVR